MSRSNLEQSGDYYFATCAKGLEDLLLMELERLALPQLSLHTGGVSFIADIESAFKACLWSRVASRVLLRLKAFDISSEDELYAETDSIDWALHFSANETFAIDCISSHSTVNNSHYAALRVKDAIVDQFRKQCGQRPSINRQEPDIRINVYLADQRCFIYLDLSGEALHKRGYRRATGEAPLRETLAAAMLYRAKWPLFAADGKPFYDPMCGSGTLLIEAAMMAGDIAPGLQRKKFGFENWRLFDSQKWQSILLQAREIAQQGMNTLPVICGNDISADMLKICRRNIDAAGLTGKIQLFCNDVTKNLETCSQTPGLMVSNPPYGKRIGQIQHLRTLYHRLGKQLKAGFNGWTVAIITPEHELAKSLGLRASRKNTLYNGAIRSTLYQYTIGAPDRPNKLNEGEQSRQESPSIIDHDRSVDESSQAVTMFINRLRKNYRHLSKWARKNNISCYRVYDADIPQYAVAIDRYEDWVHVQEYQAPESVDRNRAFQRVNDVLDVVADILQTKQQNVVLKVRKKQQGSSQYLKQDDKQHRIRVHENGLAFFVNLHDYIDTGLFLDHRITRQLIRQLLRKRHFLNLFAYTGSATVYAAAGGAITTTTVDMSNTYLDWAKENMKLNGYSIHDNKTGRHRYIREDCLLWIKRAIDEKLKYQLIFIDPPTFSNSKKMSTTLDIRRDHVSLLHDCLALLADDGLIVFSTNAKNFRLDDSLSQSCHVKQITTMTTSEDFRRKPLHQCWLLAKQPSLLSVSI